MFWGIISATIAKNSINSCTPIQSEWSVDNFHIYINHSNIDTLQLSAHPLTMSSLCSVSFKIKIHSSSGWVASIPHFVWANSMLIQPSTTTVTLIGISDQRTTCSSILGKWLNSYASGGSRVLIFASSVECLTLISVMTLLATRIKLMLPKQLKKWTITSLLSCWLTSSTSRLSWWSTCCAGTGTTLSTSSSRCERTTQRLR